MSIARNPRSTTRQARARVLVLAALSVSLAGVSAGGGPFALASQHLASASSLEGYSCQHPYRVVKDLRRYYRPTQLAKVHSGNPVGPYLNVRVNHVSASLGISYLRSSGEGLESTATHPSPITSVELNVQWWVNPITAGKICTVKMTFHGLRTFVSHSRGGHRFTFHHVHTDRPLRLEITAAR
jgi:hypothetical protein